MTGAGFVLLIGIVLFSALFYTAYTYFFGKSKNTAAYTFEDEKIFRNSSIEKTYGKVFNTVFKSLQKHNPWFKKIINEEDYLNESFSISIRLEECKKKTDIFKVIDEEFFRWRGYGSLNPKFYDRVQQASDDIWEVWKEEFAE